MCADRSYEPVSRTGRVCHAHCGMVGAAFAGAIACVPEATIVASAGDSSEDTMAWCTPPAAAVDILFVIDDSPSMAVRQDWLAASLQGSWLGLEEPARVRIAFTTTDTGNPLCDPRTRDDGALLLSSCRERLEDFVVGEGYEEGPADTRETCLHACRLPRLDVVPTTTALDGTPRPRPWLELELGPSGVSLNLEGTTDLAEALACAGMLGHAGCEHESPIDAATRALRRMHDATDSAYGFLRSDAHLLIAIVTDEDDCSVQDPSAFDPDGARALWPDATAERGPSALCVHAGTDCSGPDDALVCTAVHRDANGDTTTAPNAVLRPLENESSMLESIARDKPFGRWVRAELVAGLPPSGELSVTRGEGAFADEYGYAPGCDGPLPPAASPVRLLEWVESWGGAREPGTASICVGGSLLPSSTHLPGRVRPTCFAGCAADIDSSLEGLQPSCVVAELDPDGNRQTVPRCVSDEPPPGADACWIPLTAEAMSDVCVDAGWNLELRIVPAAGRPRAGVCTEVTCEVSSTPLLDCPDLP